MFRRATLGALFCSLVFPLTAGASPADDKLGEAFTKAAPGEKLAMIAVAKADNVLDHKESSASVAELSLAEIKQGETPEARLKRLGALRATAEEKLKEINAQRKEEKKRWASLIEPDSNLQLGVALDYIATTAKAKPSLEALGCLALVRESTSWTAHHKLVLAVAQEAFSRDAAFLEADLAGKLSMIKNCAEDRGMLSDHERSYLENAVLCEWMSAELVGGKTAGAVAGELKTLRDRKQICFFTYSWANRMLESLKEIRGEE